MEVVEEAGQTTLITVVVVCGEFVVLEPSSSSEDKC